MKRLLLFPRFQLVFACKLGNGIGQIITSCGIEEVGVLIRPGEPGGIWTCRVDGAALCNESLLKSVDKGVDGLR
jgi:hypothetical protein